MTDVLWSPFDFSGTIKGNGLVISNLTVTSSSGALGVFKKFTGNMSNVTFENLTRKDAKLTEIFNFTALLFSLSFLIYALEPILTLVFFYKAFLLYTFYIAWIGTERFIEIPNENRVVFTTICGLSVICTPILISKLLTLLMPGLL